MRGFTDEDRAAVAAYDKDLKEKTRYERAQTRRLLAPYKAEIKRLRAALTQVQGWIVDHDRGFGVNQDAEWTALDEIVRAALEEVPRG